MSRIGKQPIDVPTGVTVTIAEHTVSVKGPKGELSGAFPVQVAMHEAGATLTVSVQNAEDKKQRALWGLWRSLVQNMIQGVTEGFVKQLELVGVGYKAEMKGKEIELNVGFSHPVLFSIPEGITAAVEKNSITISGIDKQLVGEVAANIRKVRKPEPYKGKGIKYTDEIVRRKAGKTVKGVGT
jgi:large subunit ribosomal protein L6